MNDTAAPSLIAVDTPQTSEARLTLRLSPTARAELDWVANEMDTSMTEAVKRAIGLQKLALELRQAGARILVEQPGQPRREIMIV